MRGKGRHDPCVLPRAVPMVEAMVALVLADALMSQAAQCGVFPKGAFAAQGYGDGADSINQLGKKLTGLGFPGV